MNISTRFFDILFDESGGVVSVLGMSVAWADTRKRRLYYNMRHGGFSVGPMRILVTLRRGR